jgi:hypothetical protein
MNEEEESFSWNAVEVLHGRSMFFIGLTKHLRSIQPSGVIGFMQYRLTCKVEGIWRRNGRADRNAVCESESGST